MQLHSHYTASVLSPCRTLHHCLFPHTLTAKPHLFPSLSSSRLSLCYSHLTTSVLCLHPPLTNYLDHSTPRAWSSKSLKITITYVGKTYQRLLATASDSCILPWCACASAALGKLGLRLPHASLVPTAIQSGLCLPATGICAWDDGQKRVLTIARLDSTVFHKRIIKCSCRDSVVHFPPKIKLNINPSFPVPQLSAVQFHTFPHTNETCQIISSAHLTH